MKKYTRILIMLMAAVMVAACVPAFALEKEEGGAVLFSEAPEKGAILMDGDPYYIPSDLENAIKVALTNRDENLNIVDLELDISVYYELKSLFEYMHPEFWFAKIACSYNPKTGKMITLNFTYEPASKVSEYEAVVADILDQIDEDLSDFGKILWIHDYLCLNCEYDYQNYCLEIDDYPNKYIPDDSYTPYGALVNHIAVCQGYTLAFMDLLARDKIGIQSIAVESGDMNHVWLAVLLDGAWYHVDATWDDPTAEDGSNGYPGEVYHDWFLRREANGYFYNPNYYYCYDSDNDLWDYYDWSTVDWNDPNTYPSQDILLDQHYNYTFMFESEKQKTDYPLADTSYGSLNDTTFWNQRNLPIYPILDGESTEYYYYFNTHPYGGQTGIWKREFGGSDTLEFDMSTYPDYYWPAAISGYYTGLSGFQLYDGQFYVNTPTKILAYDYSAHTSSVFAEPELEADYEIFGLELQKGATTKMAYKVAYDYYYDDPAPEWRVTPFSQITVTASSIDITVPAGYFSDYGILATYNAYGRFTGLKLVDRSVTNCSFANPSSIHDIALFRLSDDVDWNAARATEAIYTAGE